MCTRVKHKVGSALAALQVAMAVPQLLSMHSALVFPQIAQDSSFLKEIEVYINIIMFTWSNQEDKQFLVPTRTIYRKCKEKKMCTKIE